MERRDIVLCRLATLAGKNVACWRRPEQLCHAVSLLELENR